MKHELKIWPEYFRAVSDRSKMFEYRKIRDRDFNVGDLLVLNEWCPKKQEYTGRFVFRNIQYCLWLNDGVSVESKQYGTHVIMSLS